APDGGGNVVALINSTNGVAVAIYEFDPFGRALRATGQTALENPFRFSSKRANDSTDLILYEYRTYHCSSGKWLSADPAEERGGKNLFNFVGNDPITGNDPTGL